jgi:hypothetical protein
MMAPWWRRDEPGLFARAALATTETPDMLMQVKWPLSFTYKFQRERGRSEAEPTDTSTSSVASSFSRLDLRVINMMHVLP